MKYNTIIFDLDGTISNTESGIFKAFRKMMKEFGVDESKFDLKKFIGPPIQWSFYQIFGDDMRLFKALDYFRGVYLDFMTDNTLYDGVKELLEKLVDNTDFATGVYDPFGGSGTTLAACEAYGQPSYIMELTPAFTDVIVKRYIRITGKTTVRCVRQGRELPREEIAAIFEPDEEGGEQE